MIQHHLRRRRPEDDWPNDNERLSTTGSRSTYLCLRLAVKFAGFVGDAVDSQLVRGVDMVVVVTLLRVVDFGLLRGIERVLC